MTCSSELPRLLLPMLRLLLGTWILQVFFVQSLHNLCPKMKLLIFAILLWHSTEALRFSHVPITVDSDVIVVNKPAKLTCNYVKFKTETVREINWYISYEGFRSKIFHYQVTAGHKEDSIYSHIKTDGNTATEKELTLLLPESRGSPITVACEVEVLRDNGYGKLSHTKKQEEIQVTVVDSSNHFMTLKNGKWDGSSLGNLNQFEASVGQPLLVSCISRNANPGPNLTLTLNGQPWEETSATSRIEEIRMGVPTGSKVIEGRMDTVYQSMFNADGVMAIECKASYQDYVFDKKQLGLRAAASQQVVSDLPRGRPSALNYQEAPRHGYYQDRQGRIVHHSDEGHDADIIHNRLLDLLDPARHMHPGIPYDFYSGYILMVAKNVDIDDNDINTGSSYGSYGSSRGAPAPEVSTHLYGKLPDSAYLDLQRNYGRFRKVSDNKFTVEMNPVDILNLLGNHGYRVIGFTAEADKKMVWTLEQKDFESKINAGNQGHQHQQQQYGGGARGRQYG